MLIFTKPKYIILVVTVLLFVWMVFDRTPEKKRIQEIETALAAGQLGGLSAEENKNLAGILQWLMTAIDEIPAFTLNGTPKLNTLNIYTVNTDQTGGIFCGRGNAVYEAPTDVIFLDIELFRQSWLKQVFEGLTDEHISLSKVYCYFIILHELGHRVKHRDSGVLFDLRSKSTSEKKRLQEEDADTFALKTMVEAYRIDRENPETNFIAEAGEAIYLNKQDNKNDVWIDLGAMAQKIPVLNLLSDSPYSSLYSDMAHPSFVERSLRLLKVALKDSELTAQIRSHLIYAKHQLERMVLIQNHLMSELTFPEPPTHVALSNAELAAITKSGKIFFFFLKRINNELLNRKHPHIIVSNEDAIQNHISGVSIKFIWYANNDQLYGIDSTGKTYKATETGWSSIYRATDKNLGNIQKVHTSHSNPDECLIIEGYDDEYEDYFEVYCEGKLHNRKSVSALEKEISSKMDLKNISLEVNLVYHNNLYLTINEYDDSYSSNLVGYACLELETLKIKETISLQLTSELANIESKGGFVILPTQSGFSFYVFSSYDGSWTVWEVFNNKPPILSASHRSMELVLVPENGVAGRMAMNLDPIFDQAFQTSFETILVAYEDDSLYVFDPYKKKLEILFHPCCTKFALNQSGNIAIYDGEYAPKIVLLNFEERKKQ